MHAYLYKILSMFLWKVAQFISLKNDFLLWACYSCTFVFFDFRNSEYFLRLSANRSRIARIHFHCCFHSYFHLFYFVFSRTLIYILCLFLLWYSHLHLCFYFSFSNHHFNRYRYPHRYLHFNFHSINFSFVSTFPSARFRCSRPVLTYPSPFP